MALGSCRYGTTQFISLFYVTCKINIAIKKLIWFDIIFAYDTFHCAVIRDVFTPVNSFCPDLKLSS